MNRTTFDLLPVTTHTAANAGGVVIGGYYLTSDLAFQQGQTEKRVSYFMRIAKIRDNETVSKVMPFTKRQIPGWEQGSNPASRTVSKTDPYDGSTFTSTETITASGAWPSGAIGYDTSAKTVTQLTYPDFKPGTSQQTDGYVEIKDILTD
jgi:hypothetical protein